MKRGLDRHYRLWNMFILKNNFSLPIRYKLIWQHVNFHDHELFLDNGTVFVSADVYVEFLSLSCDAR